MVDGEIGAACVLCESDDDGWWWGFGSVRSRERAGRERAAQIAVWNTLYLTLPASALQASVLHKKTINVLKSDTTIPYDRTHALILCSGQEYSSAHRGTG